MQRSSAIAGDLLLFQRTSSSLAHERPASASEPSGSKGGTSAADADAAALRWCGRGRLSQVKLSPLGQSQAVAGHTFTAWAVACHTFTKEPAPYTLAMHPSLHCRLLLDPPLALQQRAPTPPGLALQQRAPTPPGLALQV